MKSDPSQSPGNSTLGKRGRVANPEEVAATAVLPLEPAHVRFDAHGKFLSGSERGIELLALSFPEIAAQKIAPVLLAWAKAEAQRISKGRKSGVRPCRLQIGKSRCVVIYLQRSSEPGVFEIHLEDSVTFPLGNADSGLTQRERDVLYWISQGKRNGEIGIILGISSKTVNKHAERIFAKLGVETRGAAASMVLGALGEMSSAGNSRSPRASRK